MDMQSSIQIMSETTSEEARFTRLAMLLTCGEGPVQRRDAVLLDALAAGMASDAAASTAEAVRRLCEHCPPDSESDEAQDYYWGVWVAMVEVARAPGVTSDVHECLIRVFTALCESSAGDGSVGYKWEDTSSWDMALSDSLSIPQPEHGGDLHEDQAVKYHNLTTFAARCLAAEIYNGWKDATTALVSALETTHEAKGWEVKAACLWLTHAAEPLMDWARENIGNRDDITEWGPGYVPAGVLYHGPRTMCLQRWGFWMRRLEGLGEDAGELGDGVRASIREAVEAMARAEGAFGLKLGGGQPGEVLDPGKIREIRVANYEKIITGKTAAN